VPVESQCANLVVPVCLSASHIAYGSIRMEPVFMILGQSAATAAVLALTGSTSVQRVPYATLRARLLADGQLLQWPPPTAPGEVIVDNRDPANTRAGTWVTSTATPGTGVRSPRLRTTPVTTSPRPASKATSRSPILPWAPAITTCTAETVVVLHP